MEGDDLLEICVHISGSGESVEANVIIVDRTATGTYVTIHLLVQVIDIVMTSFMLAMSYGKQPQCT